MKAKRLTELPVPGSGCGDIRILSQANNVSVQYEYRRDGVDWVGCVRFVNIVAYRFRDELHSVGHFSESYDAVAQIEDSDWLADLVRGFPIGKVAMNKEFHYAIFFSSNGYFEVVAEKFETPIPRKGFLSAGD